MKIVTGGYTGNGTQNRAINHTLGANPVLLIVQNNTNGSERIIFSSDTEYVSQTGNVVVTVSAKTSTVFYIGGLAGGSGNVNVHSYTYFALG